MPIVHAPDGKVINFPDTMQPPDIEAAMGKLYPSTPPHPGVNPPQVNMQEATTPNSLASSAGNGFVSGLQAPINAAKEGWEGLKNIVKHPLSGPDFYNQSKGIADAEQSENQQEQAIQEHGMGNEVAKGVGEHAGAATSNAALAAIPLLKDTTLGKTVAGGVKGAASEAFKPTTYGMHKLPVVAPVAGAMAGHFAASPFGPTASKVGAVVGALTPLVKGAYEGGKDAYQGAKSDLAIAGQKASPRLGPDLPTSNPSIPTLEPIRPAAASSRALTPSGPPAPTVAPRVSLSQQAGIQTTPRPVPPPVEPMTGLSPKTLGPEDILPKMGPKTRPLETPPAEATSPTDTTPTPPVVTKSIAEDRLAKDTVNKDKNFSEFYQSKNIDPSKLTREKANELLHDVLKYGVQKGYKQERMPSGKLSYYKPFSNDAEFAEHQQRMKAAMKK